MNIGKYKVAISPFIEGKDVGKQVVNDIDPGNVGSSVGSKIGGGIKTGLKVGAAALGAAAVGIGGLGAAAIKAQAEIQQSLGGSQAVFEKSGGDIRAWAAAAAGSMGISTNAALETANKMGSLFQGAGIEVGKSAEMTMNMSKRAADVASVMGVDLESAMEAVTGAAKGNFTMMDNLGVAMNNTTLEAYAQSKGIDKSFASMENAEKIGLAYQLFMEKTSKYAGNFEKENQTLAGSFDVLKSSWQNILYSLGDSKMLDAAIGQFSEAIKNMFAAITEVLPVIVENIGKLITDLVPILLQSVTELLPVLVEMLSTALPALIKSIIDALPGLIDALVTALINLLPVLLESVVLLVEGILEALPLIIDGLVKFYTAPETMKSMQDAVTKLLFVLIDMIPVLIESLAAALPAIQGTIIQGTIRSIPLLVGALLKLIGALLATIPALINGLVKGVGQAMVGMMNGMTSSGPGMGESMKSALSNVLEAFNNWASGFGEKVKGFFKGIADWIRNIWGSTKDIGENLVKGIWAGIKAMAGWLKDKIKSFADAIIGNIKDFFGIHSPSVIMRKEVGMMLGAGVGLGLKDSVKGVVQQGQRFSSKINDSVRIGADSDFGFNDSFADGRQAGSGVTVNQYVDAPKDMLDILLMTKRGAIQGLQGAK